MDPTVIVGYLVAKLLGEADRLVDRKVSRLLESLFDRVWSRLGGNRALDRLAADPRNEVAQEWARSTIDEAAAADPAFRATLMQLQQQLQAAAPNLLVYAPGADTVVGVNSGYLITGGNVTIHQHGSTVDDWSSESAGVKALAVLGGALCLLAFGIFGYTLFGDMPDIGDEDFGQTPPGIPVAAAVFFAGFVIMAIANVVHALHRRPAGR